MLMTPETKQARKNEIMETCFECFCKNGLQRTGMLALGRACNTGHSSLYKYFTGIDDIIIESTAYCMSKVEEEFMACAPKCIEDAPAFLKENPKWTAKKHGAKYRFMYQVYTSPQYREAGKAFFDGVQQRYAAYAKVLAPQLGIPEAEMQGLIFLYVRSVVHYALFEEEHYLEAQTKLILQMATMLREQNTKKSE